MSYGPKTGQALLLAFELHQNQYRKGTQIPYITHLLSVAAIVGEYGGSEQQFIAALLHDAVEDQGGEATRARIAELFGPGVAHLVDHCSDAIDDGGPKPPWRARKEAHIAATAETPHDARLILAADKLHNIRSVTRDLRQIGPEIWNRFNAGREGSRWYYGEMRQALGSGWEHPILQALDDAIAELDDAIACTAPGNSST